MPPKSRNLLLSSCGCRSSSPWWLALTALLLWRHVAARAHDPEEDDEEEEKVSWWMPIYMSAVAGASTCIGAAIVFCQPYENDGKNGRQQQRRRRRSVSPSTMAFCLALAGSVMMTVSIVSIGPECLTVHDTREWIPLFSWLFVQRLVALGLGCLLYLALSYFAFPEVDQVLGMTTTTTMTSGHYHHSSLAMEEGNGSADGMEMRASTPGPGNKNESVLLDQSEQSQRLLSATTTQTPATLEHGGGGGGGGGGGACRRRPSPTMISSSVSTGAADVGVPGPQNGVGLFHWTSGKDLETREQRKAWRVAMLLFASLLFHNFPEGLAVAASALESRQLGMAVTIGIMIHNIPEGIAIAVPCLAARPQDAWMAFGLASLSGLAEPLGATVALFCFSLEGGGLENILALVAGIMMSVALFDLFPEARKQKTLSVQPVVAGTVLGIVIMVVTELSLPA